MLHQTSIQPDRLAIVVEEINRAYDQENYERVHRLIITEVPAVWFGIEARRFLEMLRALIQYYPPTDVLIRICYEMLTTSHPDGIKNTNSTKALNPDNPVQQFYLTLFQMFHYRRCGYPVHALEQSEMLREHLRKMPPFVVSTAGWKLHVPVQVGISAVLAGDFTKALAAFTEAQLHPPLPTSHFLTRQALVQSALVQAAFGNITTARGMLERSDDVPRTSSWIEPQIDAHRDIAFILINADQPDLALATMNALNLHNLGEMWPFYVLASFRLYRALGQFDELEHHMDMLDSMPFPMQDGEGFAGSVIALKKASLAMRTGRVSEAQELIDRADQRLPYTRVIQAALHLYAGRAKLAVQEALQLHDETRGFRQIELRRLAILAMANLQINDTDSALEVLAHAASFAGGLQDGEVVLFSPECREVARDQIANWPHENSAPSIFLTNLPDPGQALTDREIEILTKLAAGSPRATIAESLSISVNTLKTQLRSIYRKLNASSREEAICGGQRRGII